MVGLASDGLDSFYDASIDGTSLDGTSIDGTSIDECYR